MTRKASSLFVVRTMWRHHMSQLWKTFWKAKVPVKVRMFWWCVSLDILPMQEKLLCKHVYVDLGCLFCGAHLETAFHMLRDCPFEITTWVASHLGVVAGANGRFKLQAWINMTISSLSLNDLPLFLMIGLGLWEAQNSLLWRNAKCPPDIVTQNVVHELLEFTRANGNTQPHTEA